MKIAVGSDHAGFELKQALVKRLAAQGHQVEDMGTGSSDSCDYPVFGEKVALAVSGKKAERGILVCGSGIGMSIAANKVPGVRAALVFNEGTAAQTRQHNDSNVLCLAGKELPVETNLKLADIWLNTEFSNVERHVQRVGEIAEMEGKYMKTGKAAP